jgi:Bacterial regulatory proteins, tetR family
MCLGGIRGDRSGSYAVLMPDGGRTRDSRINDAILGAAADLLVEVGYSNLTMGAIAERAGTTRTALYRRWSTKADLIHDAAFPSTPTVIPTWMTSGVKDISAIVLHGAVK